MSLGVLIKYIYLRVLLYCRNACPVRNTTIIICLKVYNYSVYN